MSEPTPNSIGESQNIASRIRNNIGAFEHALDISPGDEEILDILTQIDALIEERILHLLYEEPCSLEGKSREQIETEIIDEALSGTQTSIRGSVYHLLEITCDRLYTLTAQTDFQSILERLNILHLQTEQVILPPDELHRPTPSGESNGESFESPSFPKLGHLIQLLREHEIYTDDLIVLSGILRRNQLRTESYLLIEIPRLQRSVLLCNAYGEASFVYQGILPRERAWTLTKTLLQEQCKNSLIKISYSDDHIDRWRAEMTAALFQTRPLSQEDTNPDIPPPNPPGEKINVRERETYRTEIIRCYPTPKEWMGMSREEKIQFKIHGKGFHALTTIFGVKGNPRNNSKDMAILGKMIYGEGYDCIECELWNAEEWKKKIREICPIPEDWMGMNTEKKQEFKVYGKGIYTLATIFNGNVSGNYATSSKNMAELGREIYGPEHEIIECEFWNQERWKKKIHEICSSAEEWMGMTTERKLQFKVNARGMKALATIFDVCGNPQGNSLDMATLGKVIYGEGHEVIECELWTPEQWKEKIIKKYPTADEWMQITGDVKRKLKVHGIGLTALTKIFGIIGNPKGNSKDMAALGKAIYGEGHVIIERELWTPEQWKEKIIENCGTAEQWMQMNQKEKQKFIFQNRGITAIARTFGMNGDPIGNSKDMAALGKVIYGEGHVIIERELWTPEQWKEKIIENCGTAEQWMQMDKREKQKFIFQNRGITAIARIFGMNGDPVGISKDMAMLGRAIYGNDPIFEKYIPAPIEETTES
jgi:hypothetical protein